MQTLCSQASNIVDLAELRRRQGPAQRGSLACRPKEELWSPEPSGFCPVVLTSTLEERRRARRERQAWRLEICSSLAVILMTAVFTLRILL